MTNEQYNGSFDLTNAPTQLIIFEIDDHLQSANFINAWIDAGRPHFESGKGWWRGVTNTCYVMAYDDFHCGATHFLPLVRMQEEVMYVYEDGTATIENNAGDVTLKGRVRKIKFDETDITGATILESGAYEILPD